MTTPDENSAANPETHSDDSIDLAWDVLPESKLAIIRPAIEQFLAGPKALLDGFEQATLAHKRATA